MATEKPFIPISFTLASNERQQYETAGAATVYVSILSGAGLSLQFDENDPFPAELGNFIRVQRFDKIRVINDSGITLSGTILVSSDPDFLFLRGL